MRNLTIKREKCFIASVSKIKIYTEVEIGGELTINGTTCRKIGELKNGEEKTFEIENNAAKIFVIADKLSKNFCCEYYQLPEGEEDISLTGKCHFDFFAGNAFRFENNDSEEVVSFRKKNKKRGVGIMTAVIAVCIVIGAVAGFWVAKSQISGAKNFSADGLTITLTGDFWESNISSIFNSVYDSKDIAIFTLKEQFSLLEGLEDYTVDDYIDLMVKNSDITSIEKKSKDGLTWFEYTYENTTADEVYRYFIYVYKTDDAFWSVQFALLDEKADTYRNEIFNWAKSVKFDG